MKIIPLTPNHPKTNRAAAPCKILPLPSPKIIPFSKLQAKFGGHVPKGAA